MSTNSALAEGQGSTLRGRYCHSDGYPTWQGRQLWTIVQRDGVEKARQVLLHEHYGWSFLDAERDAAGFEPHARMLGDRCEVVSGYGLAYTDEPAEWTDPLQYEWAWVLNDDGLTVVFFGKSVEFIPWDGPQPDWAEIERKAYGQ